jgi:hypothetical protein
MPDVVYFASDSQGKWELSDAERKIGHIEQVGMEFTIKPTQGSILEGMEVRSYPSRQEATEAVEIYTGAACKPIA